MSDYASSLPVRSEADGTDERLQTKIVDATSPDTQQMEVDSDGNAHVEMHGNIPAGTDIVMRLSELGAPNPDGDYDVTNNTKPASVGMIAHDRNASPADTTQNQRVTAVSGSDDTVCLDVAIRDEAGQAYGSTNPLPVTLESSEGDEVCDYDTASSVVKDATDNHDYTVTALKTFRDLHIWASASGKMKIEVQLETAAASGVFATIAVGFNSTANPNIDMKFPKCEQVAGAIIRIIRTNLDNQAQDLYSTIEGVEV